ncbi:MAG: ABC transporter substrate-binding protein [Candidatus Rokubacteria bacterium]|nr:ABC transporter substrate-binding protein [Candidatus Rokubacteria bacterium]
MTRASLGLLLALAAVAAPHAGAQPVGRPYRIGILHEGYLPAIAQVQGLKAGLKVGGLEEGRDVTFEVRVTRGTPEAAPAAAAELVKAGVDLIFTSGEGPTHAAKAASRTIPIVFVRVGDPVAAGIVAAIAQPGGNVTGVSSLQSELVPKRLEVLKALVPALRRVRLVYHVDDRSSIAAIPTAQEAASRLRLELVAQPVRTLDEVVGALKAFQSGDGLLAPLAPTLNIPGLIRDLTIGARVPAIFYSRDWVEGGALVSYGSNNYADGVQAARLVARILRGARPQDLPVEGTNKIELVLNLKTARSLGVTIPREILARADQVIE